MSDMKISDLPSATSVNSSDIVAIVQSGTTKRSVIGLLGVRAIDLGMVSIRDACLYGTSRPLIPYAEGRLIKSVRFAEYIPDPTMQGLVYFVTPNTAHNSGFGFVGADPQGGTDTLGLMAGGNATLLDLSDGNTCQIEDPGPLVAGWGAISNFEYLPLGSWQPNTAYGAADGILDSNGHAQFTAGDNLSGVSGGTEPVWSTVGGSVVDGSLLWTDAGLLPTGEIHVVAEVIEGVSPMPPYPATIEFVAQPQGSVHGQTMPNFTVMIKDQSGQPFTRCARNIFVSFIGNGVWSAGGSGSEANAQTNASTGIATFSGYAVQDAGTYIICARLSYSVAAAAVISHSFNVT